MKLPMLAAAVTAMLAIPAAATAHVTLQPKEVPAGEFVRMDVRVPNERDDAGTRKVQVQFPPGFASAGYEPKPGWSVAVKRRKAAAPIDLHGEQVDEEIDTVTWTGTGEQGLVPPGAFADFGLSVRIPDAAGETLTFKALQTYEGGEVVRWIGAEDADEPAPTVSVVAAGGQNLHSPDTQETPAAPASRDTDGADDEEGAPKGVAYAALGLGTVALLLGLAGTLRRRAATS